MDESVSFATGPCQPWSGCSSELPAVIEKGLIQCHQVALNFNSTPLPTIRCYFIYVRALCKISLPAYKMLDCLVVHGMTISNYELYPSFAELELLRQFHRGNRRNARPTAVQQSGLFCSSASHSRHANDTLRPVLHPSQNHNLFCK